MSKTISRRSLLQAFPASSAATGEEFGDLAPAAAGNHTDALTSA